jgi:5-methylthioadenosine/S-adenosylhomocysteine deaminase
MRHAMTDVLMTDATIVTADTAGTIHYGAALVVSGDRIAAIGPANTHTHFPMTLARGIYEDLSPPHRPPFTGGLARLPLPDLTRGELEVMVRIAALEAIRCGTTLVLEDGSGLVRYADVLGQSGLRYLAAERAWDRANAGIGQTGPFDLDPGLAQDGVDRIAACHAKWNGAAGGRLRIGVAAWAPDMCSPELLGRLADLRAKLDTIGTLRARSRR